jgi:NADPH-dependent 2,4-dienoyl-CoA reductase/sulfur reductase-like enzyme
MSKGIDTVIVIGASHAGVGFVDAMRRYGFAGDLLLIDRLRGLPMERPPLSKAFLSGTSDDDAHLLRSADWYERQNIALIDGVAVSDIDAAAKTIRLDTGETHAFDALVLATGAVPRMLPDAVDLLGVHVLRNPDDAKTLRAAIAKSDSAIVIGGGYIGLEVAASLNKSGKKVHVIEAADRLLARVASPAISDFFHAIHSQHEVQLHVGVGVASMQSRDGAFTGVTLSDGTSLSAQLLLVGIGVEPDMALARIADVECGNGILVGPDMQTDKAGIYAIGDAALSPSQAPKIGDQAIRVESVHNAQDSAARAAAAIMGVASPEWQAPWFWSEQYDVRLQSAGIVPPVGGAVQQIIRPGKREGGHSVWTFDGDRLCAIEAVRDPAGYMLGKKCLDHARAPHPEDVANPDFDLKGFLAG